MTNAELRLVLSLALLRREERREQAAQTTPSRLLPKALE